MRYEKRTSDLSNNFELLQNLLREYEEIRANLEKALTQEGKSDLYSDLINLIIKISDYIFRNERSVQEGIGDIMGGQVLMLESERLRAEGRAEGEVKGEERLSCLINNLIQDHRDHEIHVVVTDAARRRQLYGEYHI